MQGLWLSGDKPWREGSSEAWLSVAIHASNAHHLVAAYNRANGQLPMAQMVAAVEQKVGKRMLDEDVDHAAFVAAIDAIVAEGMEPGLGS
jgi:hypothetical protein